MRTCPSFCAPARELRGVARRRRIGSWRSLASGNRLKHCRRHGGESEIHQCRMCKGSWSHMRSACVGIQCLSAPSSAAFVVCMPVLKLVRRMWFMRCMSRGHRCIMQCSNPFRSFAISTRCMCIGNATRLFRIAHFLTAASCTAVAHSHRASHMTTTSVAHQASVQLQYVHFVA